MNIHVLVRCVLEHDTRPFCSHPHTCDKHTHCWLIPLYAELCATACVFSMPFLYSGYRLWSKSSSSGGEVCLESFPSPHALVTVMMNVRLHVQTPPPFLRLPLEITPAHFSVVTPLINHHVTWCGYEIVVSRRQEPFLSLIHTDSLLWKV